MRLVTSEDNDDPEDGDDLDVGMDDADDQELEAIAYRFAQIIPDQCEKLAKKLVDNGINHPVIFLCDVADPFGLAIANKVSTPVLIEEALDSTDPEFRPGVIDGIGLDNLEGEEPTIFHAITGRMAGLIGYFPIIVAAKAGFTVFPWPYRMEEGSKFKLFSRT